MMNLHIKRKGKRSVVHIDGSTAHYAMRTCQTDPVGGCKSRTIASTQKTRIVGRERRDFGSVDASIILWMAAIAGAISPST